MNIRKFTVFFSFFIFILSGQTSLNQISNKISNNALVIYETDKEEAISLSRQALVADPSNAYAWAVAGNILRKNKKFDEAESFFQKSLELNPLLKEGLYWGAKNNISLNNIDEANQKLEIFIIFVLRRTVLRISLNSLLCVAKIWNCEQRTLKRRLQILS